MVLVSAFVNTAIVPRVTIEHRRALCPRRNKTVLCSTGQQNGDTERKGEENQNMLGQLPPGSASSKATNKADLGFVGADRIGISFICTAENCNTRVVKSVRRRSYEKGTIVIQCPSCMKYHVVADNTGMYSSLTSGKINIEEIAKAKGQSVTRVDNTIFNLENVLANFTADKNEEKTTGDDGGQDINTSDETNTK